MTPCIVHSTGRDKVWTLQFLAIYVAVPYSSLCKITEIHTLCLLACWRKLLEAVKCQLLKTDTWLSVSCGPCTNMPLFRNSSGLCIRQTPVVWCLVPMLDGTMCELAALFLQTQFCQSCWFLACSDWQFLMCGSSVSTRIVFADLTLFGMY